MAQHARPKVAGHTELRRAHFTRSSSRPVRKLCGTASRPPLIVDSTAARSRALLPRLGMGCVRVQAVAARRPGGAEDACTHPLDDLTHGTPVDRPREEE